VKGWMAPRLTHGELLTELAGQDVWAESPSREHAAQWQSPVAVISESLAKRLWPNDPLPNILERTIREGNVTGPEIAIVGVVADARLGSADRELAPQLYKPHHQSDSGRMTLVLLASGQPSALVSGARAEVKKLAPNLPIIGLQLMKEIILTSIAQRRFEMLLIVSFAVVALLLGVIGVYGVVSYSVANRLRDIGFRMVLGATPQEIMGPCNDSPLCSAERAPRGARMK